MSKYGSFLGGVLGSLFKEPATSAYPFVKREYTERTRGSIAIDIDACIFCGACEKRCPSSAIKVDRKTKTWSIDRMGCVQCENCVNGCPKKCLSTDNQYTAPATTKTVDVFKQETAEEAHQATALPKADLDNCVYCTLCAKNCPQNALDVDRAAKTWKLDADNCVSCGLCAEKCPKKCIEMSSDAPEKVPAFMSGYNVEAMPDADLEACVFCGLCQKGCPQGALSVDRENKTWTIDKEKCIQCGICAYKCPKKCIEMK